MLNFAAIAFNLRRCHRGGIETDQQISGDLGPEIHGTSVFRAAESAGSRPLLVHDRIIELLQFVFQLSGTSLIAFLASPFQHVSDLAPELVDLALSHRSVTVYRGDD